MRTQPNGIDTRAAAEKNIKPMGLESWTDIIVEAKDAAHRGDFRQAHALLDPLESHARAADDPKLAGKVAFYRGIFFDSEGQSEQACSSFRTAIRMDTLAHGAESLPVADATSSLAIALNRSGQLLEASEVYLDAAQLYATLGNATRWNDCVLRAGELSLEAGDLEGCLDKLEGIDNDASPAHQVNRLLVECEVYRRQTDKPASSMSTALDIAIEATRVTGPATDELIQAKRRAWLSYAFLTACFKKYDAAAIAYSVALLLSSPPQREEVRERADIWSAEGHLMPLRDLEPNSFIVAAQSGNGTFGVTTVYHPHHGVHHLNGLAGAVGEPVLVHRNAKNFFQLGPAPEDS